MLVRLVGLVMCKVSMIGVHGDVGECMLIGDMSMLKGEWVDWVMSGV